MRRPGVLLLLLIASSMIACGGDAPSNDPNARTAEDGSDEMAGDFADLDWPREIVVPEATVVVYQPQLDTFVDNDIEARAAVSITPAGETSPIFGAVWMRASLETDYENRTATLTSVDVPRVRFPETTPEKEGALAALLEGEIESWEVVLSLDRLSAAMEAADRDTMEVHGLNNDPPVILVRYEPAVLVFLDGDPVLRQLEDKGSIMEVINTPFLILFYSPTGTYYLNAGPDWFAARDIGGPWIQSRETPAAISALAPEVDPIEEIEGMPIDERVPEIIVSSEPAELIFIDGRPALSPISDTNLMFVSNTDSDVLFHTVSQTYYALLAGRWFASSALEGDWTFVPSDELPTDFVNIPVESENGHLLAHVAGTDMAIDAALDAQIPQTAEISIDRTIDVIYDGAPRFARIEGTDVSYAVNANGFVVLLINGRYYCCHEAVWYESDTETGPWRVCADVPDEVYTIPPSAPVYNVTYVRVYDSTPNVVYVGYTPGYTGTYVVNGCVVYGTGYTYAPYCVSGCSTWPSTWGFHVRYNPYTGWTFGLSYHSGPFHFTIGYNKYYGGFVGGWFGPRWYRPYPRHAYRAGYRAGFRHGAWHGYRRGYARGYMHGSGHRPPHASHYGRSNLYRRPVDHRPGHPPTSARPASAGTRTTPDRAAARPSGAGTAGAAPAVSRDRSNNVYTDRNGNVYRRDDNGAWQTRQGNSWQDAPALGGGNLGGGQPSTGSASRPAGQPQGSQPSTRPQTSQPQTGASGSMQQPSTRPNSSTSSLERDHQSRQRGSQRTSGYTSSRSSRSSGSGGRRR